MLRSWTVCSQKARCSMKPREERTTENAAMRAEAGESMRREQWAARREASSSAAEGVAALECRDGSGSPRALMVVRRGCGVRGCDTSSDDTGAT
jgi:hypothetical protein